MTTASSAPAPSTTATPYERLVALQRDAELLESTGAILGWDQETMMPSGGVAHRSRQLAQLARMGHELATSRALAEALGECEADPSLSADPMSPQAANLREIRVAFDRATRLPASLVEEFARVSSVAMHEWAAARKASDFAKFQPWLEKIVDLCRQKAACLGVPRGGEPWDALADLYEPGATAAMVEGVFAPLRIQLQTLVSDLMAGSRKPSNRFNEFAIPFDRQEKLVRFVAEKIGFDFSRGRLDRSTHPFCSGSHCNDIRLTTRFTETCLNDGLGSTMHEAGHGMYEQGLPEAHIGEPLGRAVSLGIHESQSRMWENQVGRSRQFWNWLHAHLPEFLGDGAKSFSRDQLYEAANVVEPGFIRVEADEATYNLHVMIRFEIERALLKGDLAVGDVPGVWNAKYREYLGLVVPDDRRGCLQDIHWSMGSMGYFPTYTLGNLYCAQLFEAALKAMPDLLAQFERGEFESLKRWLNVNIHAHGMRYRPHDLCQRVTGKPLSADALMRYLDGKLRPLYGA